MTRECGLNEIKVTREEKAEMTEIPEETFEMETF